MVDISFLSLSDFRSHADILHGSSEYPDKLASQIDQAVSVGSPISPSTPVNHYKILKYISFPARIFHIDLICRNHCFIDIILLDCHLILSQGTCFIRTDNKAFPDLPRLQFSDNRMFLLPSSVPKESTIVTIELSASGIAATAVQLQAGTHLRYYHRGIH